MQRPVLPLDEGLHVRLPNLVQGLLVFQEERPILEGHLIQPMRRGLGDLLDLVNGLPRRLRIAAAAGGTVFSRYRLTSTWFSSTTVTIP